MILGIFSSILICRGSDCNLISIMYTESYKYYDRIYSKFKDYNSECDKILNLLKDKQPNARTILDVAVGTGEHARILSEKGDYIIDGVDIMPEMVEIARSKKQTGEFFVGDMTNFDLGRKYDIVMCLFSSIGYVRSLENVANTLNCLKRHINDDGIMLVEPWFTPEVARHGYFDCTMADENDIKIARMSHTEIDGRIHRIHFQYLVGTKDGIEHLTEVHEMGLFTKEEMLGSFAKVGLKVEYDEKGLFGRGLYIAHN